VNVQIVVHSESLESVSHTRINVSCFLRFMFIAPHFALSSMKCNASRKEREFTLKHCSRPSARFMDLTDD
jgi:hypothetical protein